MAAISNRDRVGQMFEVLSPALDSFITRTMAAELPSGVSWSTLVKRRDETKGIGGKDYDTADVQVQLRMLTENITGQIKTGWQPFRGQLSRVHESYASELRDARDRWAHLKSFTDDDAYPDAGHRGAAADRDRGGRRRGPGGQGTDGPEAGGSR